MAHTGLSEDELNKEYIGDRGQVFFDFVMNRIQMGDLSLKLMKKIFDKDRFSKIFTHPSISGDNYEYDEWYGDAVVYHAIVVILKERFPQLRCPQGVRVLTRLKIILVSKKVLAEFAEMLGFWDFISATAEFRLTKKKPMLEDCFEAFMGGIEQQIDDICCKKDKNGKLVVGGGFRICHIIIRKILDKYPICGGLPNENGVQEGKLIYEELVDPKTRLKELFDLKRDQLGKVKYSSQRDGQLCHTEVYADATHIRGNRVLIGKGTAALQADSQQAAAKKALALLKKQGFVRPPPAHYAMFCK